MSSKNIKCTKCTHVIMTRQYLRCYTCKRIYDLDCANVSEKRYFLMDTDKKQSWKCTACFEKSSTKNIATTSKVPFNTKTRNTSKRLSVGNDLKEELEQQSLDSSDDEGNTHNSTLKQYCATNIPPDSPINAIDPNLLTIITSEIQKAVNISVRAALDACLNKEFESIRKDLASLKEIKTSLDYLSADYDKIKTDIISSDAKIKILEAKNCSLSTEINDLTLRVQLLEQHSRENNIELNGVPESKTENLVHTLKKLSDVVAYPIDEKDINTCVRVRKLDETQNRPRSIIVKLHNTTTRDGIIAAVSKYNRRNVNNKLNSSHLGYASQSPVFVSEHLSPYLKSLHAQTRKVAREKGVKYVWIRNGRIFTRKDDESPAKQIKNPDSLKNL